MKTDEELRAEDKVRDENIAAIREKAVTALLNNKTFLAITSPTAAQNAAQVKALTRQVNALIKMMLVDLTDTEGL